MDIDEVDQLVTLLRQHPEWRDTLRRELLTDAFLAMPETLAGLAEAQQRTEQRLEGLIEAQQRTEQQLGALAVQVGALAEAQQRTEQRLAGLVEQVSKMATRLDGVVGYVIERRYHDKAHAYFGVLARRIHVLTPDELDDLLDAGVAAGQIDERAAQELRLADVIARGRRDGQEVYLVVEASRVIDQHDLSRAAMRAYHLTRMGRTALPVAAGETISPDTAADARQQGVWVVTNGSVDAPDQAA